MVPNVVVGDADPAGDFAGLRRLAVWSQRWTPRVALDGHDGLVLNITGCGHLFGGDGAILSDITTRMTKAGIGCRIGAAATPAAAWAWCRYRPVRTQAVLPTEEASGMLGRISVEALRVPADVAAGLGRVGLRTISDLLALPRAPLVARFGQDLVGRLDRVMGAASEPIDPVSVPPSWSCRLPLAEPISRREDFDVATSRLLTKLTDALRACGRDARTLVLTLFRVDATIQVLEIGTGKPSRDPQHLLRLFRQRFDLIEPRFGVDVMTLEATETNLLAPEQVENDGGDHTGSIPELVDRLRTRTGTNTALRLSRTNTHVPERSTGLLQDGDDVPGTTWQSDGVRPVLLLTPPEPLNTDGPQGRTSDVFYWRSRRYHVSLIEGPERIRSEWWQDRDAIRDYYRIQKVSGRRFWSFTERAPQPTAGSSMACSPDALLRRTPGDHELHLPGWGIAP
ncbi:Y-family DNA polymerase [Azospirillum doebereinerae]|uniref:Y-family DNA polymerase n=1 Tax=Azospirillum doebereinerae TaxID=92933 RepID=UPI001EE4F6DC|nr:DNA polymerase Y family protein [Azospirillum doebereinerae]MCG5240954.1 DNA polymerase Y family protein [Azospirillum doebereinerae]